MQPFAPPCFPVLPGIFAKMDRSIVLDYHSDFPAFSKLCLCRLCLGIQHLNIMIAFD